MAGKTIIQRISLEGGAAIKAQLEAIGAAGQKAFSDLQGAVSSGRAFGGVGSAIDSLKQKAAEMSGAGRQLSNDLGNLGGAANRVAGVFGLTLGASVTGLVGGILALTRQTAQADASLQKAADAAGITTEKFQELTFAAGKVNLEEDDLTKVLTKVNKLADEQNVKGLNLAKSTRELSREFGLGKISADQWVEKNREMVRVADEEINIFQRLGVGIRGQNGKLKDSATLLTEMADAINQIPDAAERAQLSLEITGNKNTKFNSLIAKGSAGLKQYKEEMDRVAPATTRLQIKVGNELNAAFNGLNATMASTRTAIFTLFAPDQTRLIKAFQELIVSSRDRLVDMASQIAQKVTPIVDDLIAVMQGRDKDVKNNIILVLRDGIVSFATEAQRAVTGIIIPALAGLLKILDTIAQAINGIFGTKLSGTQLAVAVVIAKAIGIFGLFTSAVNVAISALGLLSAALGGPIALAVAALAFAFGFVLVRALQNIDWAGYARKAQGALDNLVAGVVGIGRRIAGVFNDAAIAISDAFTIAVEYVQGLWDKLVSFFASLPSVIAGIFNSVANAIQTAFNDAVSSAKKFIDDLWAKVTSVFSGIIERAKAVGRAISSAFSGSNTLGESAGLNDIGGKATGGPVRGPGSGTSDSILSWLSNGEFVIRADAVRKWGVNTLAALNNGINPFRGFASGGLVDALSVSAPRFATGGLVDSALDAGSALRAVNINLGDLSFGATMAEDVLSKLVVASVNRRVRSAGRKPSFVGA